MNEFINEFLDYMVSKFRTDNFDIDVIKQQLINRFNKNSLMYNHIAKGWFKNFFGIINSLGYGHFDKNDSRLYLNRQNDDIEFLMIKYGIPEKKPIKELKQENALKEVEAIEKELIK